LKGEAKKLWYYKEIGIYREVVSGVYATKRGKTVKELPADFVERLREQISPTSGLRAYTGLNEQLIGGDELYIIIAIIHYNVRVLCISLFVDTNKNQRLNMEHCAPHLSLYLKFRCPVSEKEVCKAAIFNCDLIIS